PPPFGLWIIFDFDGVKRALVDHDTFSSDLSHAAANGTPGEWFIFFDPPRHTKLRALISRAFTPRVVANLEPRIRELSRHLLDQTIERGEMDLAADFSVPLPMLVITEMIGVPAADWPRYKRWSDVIVKLARLQAAPDLLPSAIEEVLRYRSPVQWMPRATRRDVEVHGQEIPAGKLVLPMIGSANRDSKQFPDAGRFDIARDPNPHIAFGHGIHFCLGAPLSRLEARIALADLLGRLPGFALASDEPWEPRQALNV